MTHERFMACTDGHIRNAAGRIETRFSFSPGSRKVPRIAGPVTVASVKRLGPVKSVSVIVPRRLRRRRRWLIRSGNENCSRKEEARGKKGGKQRQRTETSKEGKIGREESRRLFSLFVASYRGKRYTCIGPGGGNKVRILVDVLVKVAYV